jgi:hypothetical protein
VRRQRVPVGETVLNEAFDTVQVFQNQLVASIEFDAWFPVDTFCVEFSAKPALWSVAITPRFPGSANLTLLDVSIEEEMVVCNVAVLQ